MVVYSYQIRLEKCRCESNSLSLTVSAAYMSPHPKTAAIHSAHTPGENFAKSENWLRLYDCMDSHTRKFEARSILREAHGPLSAERRNEIKVSIIHVCMCKIENVAGFLQVCAIHESPQRAGQRRNPRDNSHP